ncbi:MAG: NADP(H)-dependent aldo-keto reductase [Flavobacteriaceae bacterium]|nr:NADP(H)-dependent aldo-keto reductase [Flavobacteriaceae bacterium]
MKYTILPNTDIKVSKISLGTMTFGQQNTEKEAHKQLNYAVSQGINFVDTAEMYSVPGRAETQGSTERFIGTWLKNNREKVVLATKIAGPNRAFSYIREELNFSKESVKAAIETSLTRLQTDYIDLYQLHWPERKTNYFGNLNYNHDESDQWFDNIAEIIESMNDCIKEGKIRHYGVSNETSWGLMRYAEESRKLQLPKPITIQNPYSLLNRTFEIGLAEVAHRENIGLLAYSPLAFGVLSGKYLGGKMPENTRLKLFPQMVRYNKANTEKATQLYFNLALKNGMSLAQLALAYLLQKSFLTSVIIGATKMDQLKENISSWNVQLSEEILQEIEAVFELFPNPAP